MSIEVCRGFLTLSIEYSLLLIFHTSEAAIAKNLCINELSILNSTICITVVYSPFIHPQTALIPRVLTYAFVLLLAIRLSFPLHHTYPPNVMPTTTTILSSARKSLH